MAIRGAINRLRQRAFVVFAICMLLGLTGFVEFAIDRYEAVVLQQIEGVAKRELQEFAHTHREAIDAGDRGTFERAALNRLRNPDLAFVGLSLGQGTRPWFFGDLENGSKGVFGRRSLALLGFDSESRVERHGARFLLETSMSVGKARLVAGRDITGMLSGLRSTERQIRFFQTGVSILLMVGFWVATRWALTSQSPSTSERNRSKAGPLASSASALGEEGGRPPLRQDDLARTGAVASTVERSPGSNEKPLPPHPALRRGYHVLVVEDNPVNRTVAEEMLRRMGCRVTCAEDGLVCLDWVQEESFDLIFMDIQMPRMDGLEATRRIREMERAGAQSPTPIVALTAHSQPRDRMAAHQSGMNDHIAKPFTELDLVEALRTHCESKPAQAGFDV